MKRYLIKASFLAYFLIPLLPFPTAANERDSLSTFVQQQRISGRVLNASGRGLANVSIQVKGTTVGTSTAADGTFSLNAASNATLVVQLLGYHKLELPLQGKTTIEVTLTEVTRVIEDVVVTGYQTLSKRQFTGASTKLKAEDVLRDGVPDISRMLEGQVAGVSVQNVSGTFGAAPKIRVRGVSSINGDNKPLWVVDGIILEDIINISNEQLSTGDPNTLIGSSVAGINPNDIESIEILKDAAATSLYGARAMNGVVVVTTKKGRIGEPMVSYSGNFTTFLKPSYQQFDILNSYDQMSMYAELERKGWLNYGTTARSANGGIYSKMADLILQYNESDGSYGLRNDAPNRRKFLERYAYSNTDWFDLLFNNSLMQEHTVSMSTGTEKSQLYASTSYLNDNGWSISDQVERFTGNLRATFNPNPKFSYGLITQGSIRNQNAPGTLGRTSNPVSGMFNRDFDINPFNYAMNTSRALTAFDEAGDLEFFRRNFAPFNILHELNQNTIDLSFMDFKVQGDLRYQFLKNLKFSFEGAYRYAKTNQEHNVYENSNMPQAYRADGDATIRSINRFLYRNPDNPEAEPISVLPYGGFYFTNDSYLKSYNVRNSLDFSQRFNEIHDLRAYGFMEMRYADRQFKTFNGYGYQFDKGGTPYVDPNFLKMMVEANQDYYSMTKRYDRFLAYGLNAGYTFKDRYNFAATLRYDGSNLMGKSNTARWLPTWNISGSWNIDAEDFFKKQEVFHSAKLRASYGLTASSGPATNSSIVLRNASANRPYLSERESVISLENLENSQLTWEKMYKTNVGIDLSLLQRRLNLTVDYYAHESYDLIGRVRTGGIGGEAVKLANYADMEAKGIEATIGMQFINRDKWKWNTNLNFGHNKSKITHLLNEPNIWSLINTDGGPKVGYAQRGLFSLNYQNLDAEKGIPRFINEKGDISSAVYLQDLNTASLIYEGPIDPVFTGGFFNSVNYGNFRLSALFTFSSGNVVRLRPVFNSSYSELDATGEEFLNRWLLYGEQAAPSILDKREHDKLRFEASYPYNNYNYSTQRTAHGDFIRLKQVMLSYSLPHQFLQRFKAKSATISLVGNNIWLLYADKDLNGQDPEFFGSGGVAMPLPKQYTLSLKLGL